MKYVCDAPERKSWFLIESEVEAEQESMLMDHAVAKYFRRERENAIRSYSPPSTAYSFEQNIGLKAHIQREMPLFLTLRNAEGGALVTAMLPPTGQNRSKPIIIVGKGNSDPYPDHEAAIQALGAYFGLTLDRAHCYPYSR